MIQPSRIRIPEVRVTSSFDPEVLDLFKSSIKAMGVAQPLLVAYDGKDYWLIDGLHRLQEAKLQDMKRVPCAIIEADMKTVLLQNLALNRLRGTTKASELIHVIGELDRKYGISIDEIAKRTGLKRAYIEKLLTVTKASPKVLEALDREEIGVSHAYEIARVQDPDVQERLLAQTKMYSIKVRDLHDIVDETIRILRERALTPVQAAAQPPRIMDTIKCHLCGEEWPIERVRGFNICLRCFGLALETIRKLRAEHQLPPDKTTITARELLQPHTPREGEP